MFEQLLMLVDAGLGATCLAMLLRDRPRYEARFVRLEKHTGLPPMRVVTSEDK